MLLLVFFILVVIAGCGSSGGDNHDGSDVDNVSPPRYYAAVAWNLNNCDCSYTAAVSWNASTPEDALRAAVNGCLENRGSQEACNRDSVTSLNCVEDSLRNKQTRRDSCISVSRRLNTDATLAGRIGNYQLTLVEQATGKGRFGRGTLILRTRPEGFEMWGVASTPFYGFTDFEIKAIGAYRAGSLVNEDPHAPGVLVLKGIYSGERSILLRFGPVANQRDLERYDGAYAVLDAHENSADSFAGS